MLFGASLLTAFWLERKTHLERLQGRLPSTPDLSEFPPAMRTAVAAAESQATRPESLLEGAAELGRLYHANGFSAEAEVCWRLLSGEKPDEGRWPYYLADLRRDANDYPAMAGLLRRTVELAPEYAPAWLKLADWEFKNGSLQSAESHYRRRLALIPHDPYASLGLARLARKRGDDDGARRLLQEIVHNSPKFSTAHNLLAELLAAAGKVDRARTERWLGREAGRFREADDPWLEELDARCYDPQRLRVLGTISFQTGRSDRARTLLERAVRLAPGDPTGHALLGHLYLISGDTDRARDELEQALKRSRDSPFEPTIYVELSQAWRQLHQSEAAARVAREGLARRPDSYELHNALGAALADLGRHTEAMAAYQAALARNPNYTESNYNLGVSLLALNRPAEAVGALKRSLVLQPTYPKSLLLLGRLELDAGDLAAAGDFLRPLYDAHPGQEAARQLLAEWQWRSGMSAEEKGDRAGAERHYRDALRLEPDAPGINASLGVLLLVQRRLPEATGPLEAYHRLRPDDPQSSLFLGQLYAALGRTTEARKLLIEGERLAENAGNTKTAAHCREILRGL